MPSFVPMPRAGSIPAMLPELPSMRALSGDRSRHRRVTENLSQRERPRHSRNSGGAGRVTEILALAGSAVRFGDPHSRPCLPVGGHENDAVLAQHVLEHVKGRPVARTPVFYARDRRRADTGDCRKVAHSHPRGDPAELQLELCDHIRSLTSFCQ